VPDRASTDICRLQGINGEFRRPIRAAATLIVGFSTVILSVVSGTLLALYYHGHQPGRSLLQFIIFLPFLMPPVISGLALLIFFREIDFDRSPVTVIIGHTVFVLAIVYRMVPTRLQSMSRTLLEAATCPTSSVVVEVDLRQVAFPVQSDFTSG